MVINQKSTEGTPSRSGYTLIEVLIAVSLTLILMYAIAAIFSQVGSIMTQTQHTLEMTNNLRTTKDRLILDLENLTVPKVKAPSSKYGFFSYSEGLGGGFSRILGGGVSFHPTTAKNGDKNADDNRDWTVGDNDDILSFTVRAPAGKWFRGRCFKERYDANATIDDNIEMIESEYAEVVWFLRGTTLYRRVLLLIPDDVLQTRLSKLDEYLLLHHSQLASVLPSQGYGFFRYFDLSVHYDKNKSKIVANSLSDLSNRENRYGYWSSPFLSGEMFGSSSDSGYHGNNDAWYWLRLPTLQESACSPDILGNFSLDAYRYFRAGERFGSNRETTDNPYYEWLGSIETLTDSASLANANTLPVLNNGEAVPFIDYWLSPNMWREQESDSGQLFFALHPNRISEIDYGTDVKKMNQDVILTHVLSFDVKVWNPASSGYVDLASFLNHPINSYSDHVDWSDNVTNNVNDFRSPGRYAFCQVVKDESGNPLLNSLNGPVFNLFRNDLTLYKKGDPSHSTPYSLLRPFMPAVFDTWSPDYEIDYLSANHVEIVNPINGMAETISGVSSRAGFTVGDIPLDGEISSADLPDFPPPYDAEIKAIQIELRVFDPVSRSIKNSTVEVRLDR